MDPKGLAFRVNRSPLRFVAAGLRGIDFRWVIYLIAVLIAAFFFGCDAFYSKASKNTEKSEGVKTMEMLATTEKKTVAIPPIDAAAPLQTSTATFALG
jgi:hypothetical protein